ncbi:MAG: acyl-ACP--UDP-N-acetylglucosamine O-acyltransferase [Verrucomicrobiales bacterium]
MPIHSSAIVAENADLGSDVTVGPFAIVEGNVIIGDRCTIDAAAQIRSGSEIGSDCKIGSGAIVGAEPQFLGFDSAIPSGVKIGPRTVLREYVTVHRSIHENRTTELGSDNYLMTGAHVGHDSLVGDHNVFANDVLLGGHSTVGNHCFMGGSSAIHQFVRLGDYVMCQGLSGVSLDVPPYLTVRGINIVCGINSVGLKRAGFSNQARREIKEAFREVYQGATPLRDVLEKAKQRSFSPETQAFYDFLRQDSKKGFCIRSR